MITNMQQAIAWLEHHAPKSMSLGLERMKQLQACLPLHQPHRRHIVIGGTNGKGSTACMLARMLDHLGQSCSLYTSPHLCYPNERLRLQGQPIAPRQFYALLNQLSTQVMAHGLAPTTFELLTAAALLHADQNQVAYSILEVGLGGRLDATNVVDKQLCVITPIGLDHQAILGHTLAQIAGEKAGIFAPGVPVVLAEQPLEAQEVLLARAKALDCPVVLAQDRSLPAALCHLPLYQQRNAKTALAAAAVLGLPQEPLVGALGQLTWPGRYQWATHPQAGCQMLLDGAHNREGMAALWQSLQQDLACAHLAKVGLVALAKDKDLEPMLGPMQQHCQQLLLCGEPSQPRLLQAQDWLMHARPTDSIFPDLNTALDGLGVLVPKDALVVVTGSLMLIGHVLKWLMAHDPHQGGMIQQRYGLGLADMSVDTSAERFNASSLSVALSCRKAVPPW